MSNVSLTIGGRNFAVACDAGQEAHIAKLGRMIDDKLISEGGASGQSEIRMLLFAALVLADELHELKSAPPASAKAEVSSASAQVAAQVDALASRIEKLASHLEKQGETH